MLSSWIGGKVPVDASQSTLYPSTTETDRRDYYKLQSKNLDRPQLPSISSTTLSVKGTESRLTFSSSTLLCCFRLRSHLRLAVFCILPTIIMSASTSVPDVLISPVSPTPDTTLETNTLTLDASAPAQSTSRIHIVFSDVDGTLAHYPKTLPTSSADNSGDESNNDPDSLVYLPPSATGMRGILSARTLRQCRAIRATGTRLVLISGMRTSTLLQRIPFLPRAHVYVCEAGGRVYRVVDDGDNSRKRKHYDAETSLEKQKESNNNNNNSEHIRITPEPFAGATPADLEPFTLVEDQDWRRRMEPHVGTTGYAIMEGTEKVMTVTQVAPVLPSPKEKPSFTAATTTNTDTAIADTTPPSKSILWAYADSLEAMGLKLDTKGYATCFRINRKHQTETGTELMDRFMSHREEMMLPEDLATSVNLGCIDVYPSISGKKNWYVDRV
jgi:hypothetical protein